AFCSDADFEATVAKFDQLRDLGVTSFYIALDDIPTDMVDEDAAQFDSLADAQVHYLNRIQTEYVSEHDLEPLQTVPTEYFGSGTRDYKSTFGRGVDPDIRIQWTGEGVFSPTVTEESVAKAVETYHSEHLFIWDNFPVNDGRRDRLFLNPLEGRAPTLHEHLAGFTANPLIQPYASLISLANYADYCWNPPAYEADASWDAALDELAGSEQHARDALRVFTDLNQHWPYRDGSPHAPQLTADVEEYWASRALIWWNGSRPSRTWSPPWRRWPARASTRTPFPGSSPRGTGRTACCPSTRCSPPSPRTGRRTPPPTQPEQRRSSPRRERRP